jgi:hypothetical protein
MTKNSFVNIMRRNSEFVVYATIAVIILLVGIAMVGNPVEVGISFTTLSDSDLSPSGSVLTAIGGWMMFTFAVSYLIHRRAQRESKDEIRATSLLLVKFIKELDGAQTKSTKILLDWNKTTALKTTREMLSAQGIKEKEMKNTISKLNEDFEKQIEKLNTAISNIRSESESRMKKCCDFDVMDHVCKNVPTKEILEAI